MNMQKVIYGIFPKAWKSYPSVYHYVKTTSHYFSSTTFHNLPLPPLNYINGERSIPKSSENFELREPASGDILGQVQCSGAVEVDEAVRSAANAFQEWSSLCGSERAEVLHQAADIIRKREDEIATWDTIDTGRPLSEIKGDVAFGAKSLDYYASLATTTLDQHIKLSNGSFAYVTREPYGVVGAIGSWNFPLLGATWKVAPALAGGNTMVFKPSSQAPITTAILAEILTEAGAPAGTLNVVQGKAATGSLLCKHPEISKVSFTGGKETGKKILESCASGIKPVTLELGGKSPLIIFPDCDMENAVNASLNANFELCGESCTNGTRVFVHKSIKEDFVRQIVERTINIKVGDPMDASVQIGPLISEDHLIKVLGYVESAKKEGAQILCGGERLEMADTRISGGYYMSPCVLQNCHDDMRAVKEEIFGPVMAILTFETEEEVIRRANDTSYGLASGIFTRDLNRAHRCAAKLNAGACWVNNYNIFHPQFPVGGFKMSGIGRENGHEALSAYTQTKVVYIEGGNVDTPY